MIWNLTNEERATALATLRGARRLIEDEGRWTKGACARNAHGMVAVLTPSNGLGPTGDDCKWCMTGALWVAMTQVRRDIIGLDVMGHLLYRGIPGSPSGRGRVISTKESIISLQNFNDVDLTTHADVLAVFDRAIAALEEGA